MSKQRKTLKPVQLCAAVRVDKGNNEFVCITEVQGHPESCKVVVDDARRKDPVWHSECPVVRYADVELRELTPQADPIESNKAMEILDKFLSDNKSKVTPNRKKAVYAFLEALHKTPPKSTINDIEFLVWLGTELGRIYNGALVPVPDKRKPQQPKMKPSQKPETVATNDLLENAFSKYEFYSNTLGRFHYKTLEWKKEIKSLVQEQ